MILRDIVERPTPTPPASGPSVPISSSQSHNGFPTAVHRSKAPSAFALARQKGLDTSRRLGQGRATDHVPQIQIGEPSGSASTPENIRQSVQQENEQRIAGMTDDERQEEIGELEGRFGSVMLAALKKRAEDRKGKVKEDVEVSTPDVGDRRSAVAPTVAAEGSKTAPASEGTEDTGQAVSFSPKPRSARSIAFEDPPPSDMKERYFPNVLAEPKKLAWMQDAYSTSSSSTDSSLRFDLHGRLLSNTAKAELPTNLGLHHHGDSPDTAGYTIAEILHLSRSTIIGQRITMLGVLARIVRQYIAGQAEEEVEKACEDNETVKKGFEFAVDELISSSRNLGLIRVAIQVLYECLGGPTWTWFDTIPGSTAFRPDQPGSRVAQFDNLPFEDLIPRLSQMVTSDSLSPYTLDQLVSILRRATYHSKELAETISPLVPVLVRHEVIDRTTPDRSGSIPLLSILELMGDTIASPRLCAEQLRNDADVLAQFVLKATWPTDGQSDNGTTPHLITALAIQVLRVYHALGRYGLAASLATTLHDVWRQLGTWVQAKCIDTSTGIDDRKLVAAYFDCLTIWTTCAIDPHRTTPEHDLTWAQVSAMGWVDEALSATIPLVASKRTIEMSSIIRLLTAWIQGASINIPRAGEHEKRAVLKGMREVDWTGLWSESTPEVSSKLSLALVRLHSRLLVPEIDETLLSDALLQDITMKYISDSPWTTSTEVHLRYELLCLTKPTKGADMSHWAGLSFDLFSTFSAGDEPLALDLVDHILRRDWISMLPGLNAQFATLKHRDGLQLLRPLLQYAILPDTTSITGPISLSHLYFKATTTLRAPAISSGQATEKSQPGLPLASDWIFSTLNELLSSATSPALAQTTPDWDASEPDIVRATLLLAQIQLHFRPTSISRSKVLLNLMKVFMLEHNQLSETSTTETDVFREEGISDAIALLIAPLTESDDTLRSTSATLEEMAKPFLGSDTPFYQFYTDFFQLFEAISFSDLTFSQLLLPPLAMTYPIDFRRLLWVDHPSALRSIRVRINQVPLENGSLVDYYDSAEEDADVLAGYTRALIKGWVTAGRAEFLFDVAVHHLSCLFWEGKEEGRDSVRVSLMVAILSSAPNGVVQAIWERDTSMPTVGRNVTEDVKQRRVETVQHLTGDKGAKRLAAL